MERTVQRSNRLKLTAVTSTRADWGLFAPLLEKLRDDPRFSLVIVVTGQHLMLGSSSVEAIKGDGFHDLRCIDVGLGSEDSPRALTEVTGRLVSGIGRELASDRPDLLLLLGDRYETLGAALAATIARVPIAHLYGGDVTEGAMDDALRHAITKLSSIHFASNKASAARIAQMGEDPATIYVPGSTGIDRIISLKTLDKSTFFDVVGLVPQEKNFVITVHPATLSSDPIAEARELLAALNSYPDVGLIFTGSNADPGAREIDRLVMDYVKSRRNSVFHESLGSVRYFSALAHCDLVIGNSSSGILEAPSFDIPTINIGDRQARRLRAESVVDCVPVCSEIVEAISRGLLLGCSNVNNPYGDGAAAERIIDVLGGLRDASSLTRKKFVDRKL